MLNIRRKDYEALRHHGEETYPHECCGVLLGQMDEDGIRTVTSIARAGNTRTDSAEAHWFSCSYVITSVEMGKAVLTNSFELTGSDENNKKLEDEKVEVV